ncbi:MAG: aspartate-semialdehyde dehydrogenase [Candidatus Marinimicrobia bacterium]|jgi:aspartate-semialdehyde dehydrogenase|nr:aspartate-semialdehyde dehydrogenase [Candidatus Neomarinimicrobiota bacterium]MBT3676053.1 aspartate-semialdehyde dehydrogenase [Candidatus Neomarinimicrobiota bacterium]MBT3762432.1 aspartate-semialdehyde dehydrogenase [Candidatus Neomarinimicrobiota bacterium]MBT4067517.1 aspartate-semialdehyde dehydrogenase [Candidatus Neomarinimicrobiota bacterium]MBT4271676.1 aspartate-semialdehyde dehydrogenase [Candidatus Neomarinimicrobiota bacterium]
MSQKIKVSVLGATGMVGQNFLRLLHGHRWFQIVDVAASPRSAGKTYADAVGENWFMPSEIPAGIKNLIVRDSQDIDIIPEEVNCIFSAMDLPDNKDTRELEFSYAKAGYPIVSTSSANRGTEDVPMIIPEINPEHANVIPIQQANRGLPKSGFVAVKPNCSIQSYLVTLAALKNAGFPVNKVQVTSLQAVSGAGQAGIQSEEMKDNVIPFIGGEEEKTENEPLKILGSVSGNGIVNSNQIDISAVCTRVSVIDGHTAVVHAGFKEEVPSLEKIKSIWKNFRALPQKDAFPMAPEKPIIYLEEKDRPQPKLDRDVDKGMAVSVGRLVEDKFFDIRYVALSHNTIRGAAGGAILMAELLVEKEYINAK